MSECVLLRSISESQLSELQQWAADGLVRLWESGCVSFDYLVDTQQRLGLLSECH